MMNFMYGRKLRAKLYKPTIYFKNEYCLNACCQSSQQACTIFMQTYLYLLISTHFFILTTNLHCIFQTAILRIV